MIGRAITALTIAICGVFATTGVSSAAAIEINDRYDVMILSAVFWGSVIFLVAICYLIKHSFGLDKMPPPAPDAHGGHGSAHH
jgi:hypothetical protein